MSTIKVQIAFSAFLTLSSVFLIWQGWQLPYFTRIGPGPGFFPIWIGSIMLVASLALLVQSLKGLRDHERFLPEGGDIFRPLLVVLACSGLVALLPIIGFRLSICLFAIVLPSLLGRQNYLVTVPAALATALGTAYVFETLLKVPLPHSALPIIRDMGL